MDRATRPHSARVSCDLMKPCVACVLLSMYRANIASCSSVWLLSKPRTGSIERAPTRVPSVSGLVRAHTYLDGVREREILEII